MDYKNSANKAFIGKPSPRTVDTIRFNDRYIDLQTAKEKATGIISLSVLACLAAVSFLFFL